MSNSEALLAIANKLYSGRKEHFNGEGEGI